MKITATDNNGTVLAEVGVRIRDVRIGTPLTQAELASRAGISLRTVQNIESGKDCSFSSIISILRALKLLDNLDVLIEDQTLRPSRDVPTARIRKRATSPKHRKPSARPWVWGEDA